MTEAGSPGYDLARWSAPVAPYVSNEERIRLGLHQYGSDVPQEALDAAVAALAGPDEQPAEEVAAEEPPKRAARAAASFSRTTPRRPM